MAKKVRVARTHISDKKKRNEKKKGKKKGKKREKKQYIYSDWIPSKTRGRKRKSGRGREEG